MNLTSNEQGRVQGNNIDFSMKSCKDIAQLDLICQI